jgi:uncharacterized protein YceH (UPF0502 family)
MAELPDPNIIESLLDGLAARPEGALVTQLPREAGRRDSRWAQLFEELPEVTAAAPSPSPAPRAEAAPRATSSDLAARVSSLETEVAALRAEIETLKQARGA